MSKPPPAPPKDARRFPRFELFASVELAHEDTTLVLPARNISLGGIFLSADGNDLTIFPVGEEVEVMLFDALDEGQTAVRAMATARSTARALFTDSWYSSSGTESATRPAPACT